MSGELVQRLPEALAAATTPDEADLLRREVEAFIAVARKAPAKRIEVEWPALLRLRLDAWRRWGELLGSPDEQERTAPGKRVTDGHALADGERKERERARKLAFEVPDDDYFTYRAREDADKLTLAGALRLVPVATFDDPLPEGAYQTVVADPPWRYGNKATRGAAEDHYPTMTIEQLCELKVVDHVAPDAHLYLWATNGFIREAFEVVDAWGFAYKTCLTWVKPQMGMGNYFRGSTEHVLFAVRGELRTRRRDLVNWFEAPRAQHSAKPDLFYDLVEQASPGPYLELFARRARLGDWDYWGDEALENVEVAA